MRAGKKKREQIQRERELGGVERKEKTGGRNMIGGNGLRELQEE